ncbi:hypothetical protein [Halobacteriovorax sp. HLS]|uniref:hypothetical protein n=1 Tax=Halobacteriovorax sp. HLS TaxID=2234000 RepID=UPI000FD83B29|nr:hypothetical protein [Halobacteriovorax sp. HLS]
MKEWHIRHKIFHQIFKDMDLGDDLSKEIIIEEHDEDSIVKRALQYPQIQTKELYYPGKSFCVAIIYAKLLEKHFKEDFYDSLNDERLLYENDPYFIPYNKAKSTYDRILSEFDWDLFENLNKASENFNKTCEYFDKEFLLHEDTRMFAPTK